MNTRVSLPLLSILAAAGTPGCYSTWDLKPEMVWKLDGFDGKPTKLEVSDDGEKKEIEFTPDTYLHFHTSTGQEVRAQFKELHLEGPVLVGIEQASGDQMNVDLRRIRQVQAANLSTAKTVGATAGYVAGLVPVSFGLFFGFFFTISSGGEGRPLRVAGQSSPVLAPLVSDRRRRGRRRMVHTNETTRNRLFLRWARAASEESASIPAFLALARDLEKANAPANLVRGALRAAREEANHTRLCTNLANDHATTPMTTRTPSIPSPADIDCTSLLRRLALEAFWDGCVAEGAAAEVARASARHATDETTRLALQTIAHDEANHAALAQDILAYCVSVGGRAVRHALYESFERRRADEEGNLQAMAHQFEDDRQLDVAFAQKYGLATSNLKHVARIETWEKSVALLTRI